MMTKFREKLINIKGQDGHYKCWTSFSGQEGADQVGQ